MMRKRHNLTDCINTVIDMLVQDVILKERKAAELREALETLMVYYIKTLAGIVRPGGEYI